MARPKPNRVIVYKTLGVKKEILDRLNEGKAKLAAEIGLQKEEITHTHLLTVLLNNYLKA